MSPSKLTWQLSKFLSLPIFNAFPVPSVSLLACDISSSMLTGGTENGMARLPRARAGFDGVRKPLEVVDTGGWDLIYRCISERF